MSKSQAAGGALVAIVIALGGAQAASADATAHPGPAGAAPTAAAAGSMGGMDHGSMEGMAPEAPMAGMAPAAPMAGMDHGAAPASASTAGPQASGEAANHPHGGAPVASAAPPRAQALGGFVALNGAVLAAAGVLRRRTKRFRALRASQSRSAR